MAGKTNHHCVCVTVVSIHHVAFTRAPSMLTANFCCYHGHYHVGEKPPYTTKRWWAICNPRPRLTVTEAVESAPNSRSSSMCSDSEPGREQQPTDHVEESDDCCRGTTVDWIKDRKKSLTGWRGKCLAAWCILTCASIERLPRCWQYRRLNAL